MDSVVPPRQVIRRGRANRLRYWVALSVAIHLELALVGGLAVYFWAPRAADLAAIFAARSGQGPESIDVSPMDDETSRRLLAEIEREQEKAEEEKIKKEVESPKTPGQVVDLAKPAEEKRPESARFAAEHDASADKETKRYGEWNQKARQGAARGEAEESRPAVPATPLVRPSPGSASAGALAMRVPAPRGRIAPPGPPAPLAPPAPSRPGEELAAPPEQGGELAMPGPPLQLRPPGGARPGAPPARAVPGSEPLLPSPQQIARAITSGTQDHLKDIDDGEETALNAKKWKYSSFFNRVKQQVRDQWRPGDEYRRRDPTGAIYGFKDRYTLLRVQLKPDGTLANVALELPSGIEFLDDEAIEAFKLAQPFPNPPRQLVGEATPGLIDFRFGFYFELSGAPKMRIFRYNSM